jgi:hypothetical protein
MLVCASVFVAQTKQAKKISNGERLITALANSKTLPGLFRMDSGVFAEGSKGISPDVVRILNLGKNAIPLLIQHLDDKRIFKNMVSCCSLQSSNGDGTEKVSVGDGVFFILVNIIRQTSPIYDVKCLKKDREFSENNDDCVKPKYFSGKNMKRNWLKAYRAGKIRYEKYEY